MILLDFNNLYLKSHTTRFEMEFEMMSTHFLLNLIWASSFAFVR